MRIGILTGGGDCPGLNAAIRGIVRMAALHGDECIGFENGWKGLIENTTVPLTRREVQGIIHLGGTILGTSRTNVRKIENGFNRVLDTLRHNQIDALCAIGGEDTLGIAQELADVHKFPCVGCPKTIDNDLSGTDYTFGFDTAVAIATEAIDRLHSTAEAHQRVMVVEVMGRHTGWIALYSGIAGGGDVIIIPEVEVELDWVCEHLKARHSLLRRKHSIVVVAEGAKIKDFGKEVAEEGSLDAFGHVKLGGIAFMLADEIKKRINVDSRAIVLGHLQRGGTPTARDRWLATRFGQAAYNEIKKGNSGVMVGLQGTEVVPVPLAVAVGSYKTVPPELYKSVELFFG